MADIAVSAAPGSNTGVPLATYETAAGRTLAGHVPHALDGAGKAVAVIPAQDGTDVTGVTMPTGGAGLRGWASAAYSRLAGTLTVALSGAVPAGANTIGSVNVLGGNTAAVKVDGSAVTQPVAGTSAVGVAPAVAPVPVSGVDGGGLKRHLLTDASGIVQIAARNGGTVTATVVAVAANTSTAILAANPARRSAQVFLLTAGATLYVTPLGGGVAAASAANGLPLASTSDFGAGYLWEGAAVPANAVHAFSTTACSVLVWEGV